MVGNIYGYFAFNVCADCSRFMIVLLPLGLFQIPAVLYACNMKGK